MSNRKFCPRFEIVTIAAVMVEPMAGVYRFLEEIDLTEGAR